MSYFKFSRQDAAGIRDLVEQDPSKAPLFRTLGGRYSLGTVKASWIQLFFWLVLWLVIALLSGLFAVPPAIAASLAITQGAIQYLRSCNSRIVGTSIWNLSYLVFVGIAGVLLHFQPHSPRLAFWIAVLGLSQTLIMGMYYLISKKGKWMLGQSPLIPTPKVRLIFIAALILTLVAMCAAYLGFAESAAGSIALSSLAIMASVVFLLKRKILASVVVGFMASLFSLVTFSGFSRLLLVAVVLAYLIGWSMIQRTRTLKLLVIAAIPTSVIPARYFEIIRNSGEPTLELLLSTQLTYGTGSLTSPLRHLELLTSALNSGRISLDVEYHALRLVSALVPRALWPEKPLAYGRLVIEWFYPDLGADATEYGLFLAEFLLSYGAGGIVLAIGLIALLLATTDRLILTGCRGENSSVTYLVGVLLAISLPDLFWSGSDLFIGRLFFRILALAVALGVAFLFWRAIKWQSLGSTRRTERRAQWGIGWKVV